VDREARRRDRLHVLLAGEEAGCRGGGEEKGVVGQSPLSTNGASGRRLRTLIQLSRSSGMWSQTWYRRSC
jgi:hypothetical protein